MLAMEGLAPGPPGIRPHCPHVDLYASGQQVKELTELEPYRANA